MMHAIYVRALMKAFHIAMEHWGRREPIPERCRAVFAWVDMRDEAARVEAERALSAFAEE